MQILYSKYHWNNKNYLNIRANSVTLRSQKPTCGGSKPSLVSLNTLACMILMSGNRCGIAFYERMPPKLISLTTFSRFM